MDFNTFMPFLQKCLMCSGTEENLEKHLFLESPVNIIIFVIVYLLFIFKWGPQIMRNKEPFNLKKLMIVYNAAQILLNSVVFIKVVQLVPYFSVFCSLPSNSNSVTDVTIRKVHYYYTLLKFFDFLDTIFFVLRKKTSQISLLHMHHHVGIALKSWISLKLIPGGFLFYVFAVNTFVHVVMYSYYLLNLLDPTKTSWWKKNLTQLQLIQHFFLGYVVLMHLFNTECSYSKGWLLFDLLNVTLTIFLFYDFYVQTYIRQNNKVM